MKLTRVESLLREFGCSLLWSVKAGGSQPMRLRFWFTGGRWDAGAGAGTSFPRFECLAHNKELRAVDSPDPVLRSSLRPGAC